MIARFLPLWPALGLLCLCVACGQDASSEAPRDMPAGDMSMATKTDQADMAPPTTQDMAQPSADMPSPPPDMSPQVATTGLDARPAPSSCVVRQRPPSTSAIKVERAFGTYAPNRLLWLEQTPDGSRWFALKQTGQVETFTDASDPDPKTFLDVSDEFNGSGEMGLLGMALHPAWPQSPYVYISYAGEVAGGKRVSRVLRYETERDGSRAKKGTRNVILEVDQPYGNHNGGQVSFGPDGYLYISLGDGGSANDPLKHGQNTNTLLGSILRIDVDGKHPGGIPPSNPFASGKGGKPEIFAWGLRNVWRFSFDRGTGKMFAADVGQNRVEEVNIVELGGNYGWSDKEGSTCFDKKPCVEGPWIDPIVEYTHENGDKSITGGYVYRGQAMPTLRGTYLYADYVTGRVWGAKQSPQTGAWTSTLLLDLDFPISTFAQDLQGELYIVNYRGGIHKILPQEDQPVLDTFPQRLSQTGCVDATNPLLPAQDLIPYTPAAPFWSDGATKTRFIALPEGKNIQVAQDGDFVFPVGTVLVKNFDLDISPGLTRRVETRLMMHHDDGQWGGYSYKWNDQQTEATLLETAEVVRLSDTASWMYPSRGDCMSCHTEASHRVLGLETIQLDTQAYYPTTNRLANQLDTLRHIGALENESNTQGFQALVPPDGEGALADRARSWLHTNCASCHRQDNPQRVALELRAGVDFGQMKLCNEDPVASDLGLKDAKLVVPGDKDTSLLYLRSRRRDVHGMPPISSLRVDEQGTALLGQWIDSLQGCP